MSITIRAAKLPKDSVPSDCFATLPAVLSLSAPAARIIEVDHTTSPGLVWVRTAVWSLLQPDDVITLTRDWEAGE